MTRSLMPPLPFITGAKQDNGRSSYGNRHMSKTGITSNKTVGSCQGSSNLIKTSLTDHIRDMPLLLKTNLLNNPVGLLALLLVPHQHNPMPAILNNLLDQLNHALPLPTLMPSRASGADGHSWNPTFLSRAAWNQERPLKSICGLIHT